MPSMKFKIKDQDVRSYIEKFMQQHFESEKKLETTGHTIVFMEINSKNELEKVAQNVKTVIEENMNNEVVFVSQDSTLVFDLLFFKPLYFLRKEHLAEDLEKLCNVLKKYQFISTTLTIKAGNALIRLEIKEIIYIESYGHYAIIHTQNGEYKTREKLSQLAAIVKPFGLIQIHKSYLVNRKRVDTVHGEYVSLKGVNQELPIGRYYKQVVVENLVR